MKNKLAIIGVLGLAGGLSLQASTVDITSFVNPFTNVNSGISPYVGTVVISGTTMTGVKLYCDDANNAVSVSQNQGVTYTVDVTGVNSTSLIATQTAFGNPADNLAPKTGSNLQGTSIALPTGTALYEELAWLYAQMAAVSSPTGGTGAQEIQDIQQAAWSLTDKTGEAYDYGNTTAEIAVRAWLTAAGSTSAVAGLGDGSIDGVTTTGTNYSDWAVLTAPSCVAGGWNTSACQGSNSEQEFLAYFSGGIPGGSGGSTTPEPATFWLLGGALAMGGVFTRRKMAAAKV